MRRFAKPLYWLIPVPRVRIPPSPPYHSEITFGVTSTFDSHSKIPHLENKVENNSEKSGLKIRRYLVPWGFNSPSRHHPQSPRGTRISAHFARWRSPTTNTTGNVACDRPVTGDGHIPG